MLQFVLGRQVAKLGMAVLGCQIVVVVFGRGGKGDLPGDVEIE